MVYLLLNIVFAFCRPVTFFNVEKLARYPVHDRLDCSQIYFAKNRIMECVNEHSVFSKSDFWEN